MLHFQAAFPGAQVPGSTPCGLGGSWLHYPHSRVVDIPAWQQPWTPAYYPNTQVLVAGLQPPDPGVVGTTAYTPESVSDSTQAPSFLSSRPRLLWGLSPLILGAQNPSS